MSKKYKNKKCVYCSNSTSTTGDHVFAREFFTLSHRQNLPKVPSCSTCNGKKAILEHELTAVLPFGGRHSSALENLKDNVPNRLSNNKRLLNSLQASMSTIWVSNSQIIGPLTAFNIDQEKLIELMNYITKALVYYHFNIILPENIMVNTTMDINLSHHFGVKCKKRISNDLGNGTIKYRGAQSIDSNHGTIWEYNIYGGLKFTNSSQNIFSITLNNQNLLY
ncbi:MAG: HNH endonuclease [Proteobacteria bacterium]|nr:HNH endonuclease [Pseudomonadota bacterium]